MTGPQSREASDDGLYFGPCLNFTDDETEAMIAELRGKLAQRGKIRLLTPLPRRVRLRLFAARQVDHAAIWLVDRKRFGAAERLWRACGMRKH